MDTHHKTLRAQEIILESPDGRELAALHQDKQGNVALSFRGPNGETRLSVGTSPTGMSHISLYYANGKGSIELEANDALNSAGMIVVGPSGKVQVLIGVTENGLPAFALLDNDGRPVMSSMDTAAPQQQPAEAIESFDWDSILRQ